MKSTLKEMRPIWLIDSADGMDVYICLASAQTALLSQIFIRSGMASLASELGVRLESSEKHTDRTLK